MATDTARRLAGQSNQNFSVRWTLTEAIDVRDAITRQVERLQAEFYAIPVDDAEHAELRDSLGETIGRLGTILRRDL